MKEKKIEQALAEARSELSISHYVPPLPFLIGKFLKLRFQMAKFFICLDG